MSELTGVPEMLRRADEIERRYAELHRRYIELRQQVEELSTFREIGLAVNPILDLDEVLETVILKITALFDAPMGIIYILDPLAETLAPKISRSGSELLRESDLREEPIPVGEGAAGKAIAERLGTIVETSDSCSLVEPLISKHEGIGVIQITRSNARGRFNRQDSNLLSVISSQVAVAIQNARLYADIYHQAIYLSLIAEMGRRIATILDVDELLSQVVELICTGFGYYCVDVWLIDAQSGEVGRAIGLLADPVDVGVGDKQNVRLADFVWP